MDKHKLRYVASMATRFLKVLLGLVVTLCPVSLFGYTCIPITANPVQFNGIIVGSPLDPPSPPPCVSSLGWAGVASQEFSPVAGVALAQNPRLFLVGHNAGGVTPLDKIYVGVHVEGPSEVSDKDRIVLFFRADGTGGASWNNAQDFALVYEMGSAVPSVATFCDGSPGSTQFFHRMANQWEPIALPAGIVSKTAFNATNNVWELEIALTVASFPGISTMAGGAGFRIGARLYVYKSGGGGGTTVYRWPSTLPTSMNPLFYDPNDGGVVPNNLESTSKGTCAFDVTFVPDNTTGVTTQAPNGQIDKLYRPVDGDFVAGTLPENKRTKFTAKVKFFNPANPADSSVVAPNTGKVKFFIKPYNGGFLGEYPMSEPLVTFNKLNNSQSVQVQWPETKTQWDAAKVDLMNSDHSCLKVQIADFPVDADPTNDLFQRNIYYTTLSTIYDTITISAVGVEPTPGTDILEYVLRVNWQNVPQDLIKKRNWFYSFTNGKQIGLRDLGNGYFSLPMRLREEKRLEIAITGGTLPVTSVQYQLSPRAGGKILPKPSGEPPLEIDVQPGKVVTIVANGLINVDPKNENVQPNGPVGFSDRRWSSYRFLLSGDRYEPWQNIGALVGSFDRFKTAFVIGNNMIMAVPKNAQKLSLAVNDVIGEYENNSGKGFELNVIITDPPSLPMRLLDSGDTGSGIPVRLQAGSTLPQLNVDVYQAIAFPEGKIRLFKPTGYVSYHIYASHPENVRSICGKAKGVSLVLSSFLTLFGIALLWRRVRAQNKARR